MSSPNNPLESIALGGAESWGRYAKPRLYELLSALGLDVSYEEAAGDYLVVMSERGARVRVLDLVGGYGASLLGHNNPRLVGRLEAALAARRPFNVQGSARVCSGILARRLSERVGLITGREYVVTLLSSGTEATEAAIKHAELEMARRIEEIASRLKSTMREVRRGLRTQSLALAPDLLQRAARLFDVLRVGDLEELFVRILRHNLDQFERQPCFLALEGAFHGKTSGAIKLTHNPELRGAWQRIGLRSVFLPPGDVDALEHEVKRARVPYLELVVNDGLVDLAEREIVNISACFVEPIQGEGGIQEIDTDYLEWMRWVADRDGFPLVMDEIQSGMGRTGEFLASQASGVRGDYYLLSKSLGGGLTKISAMMVEADRYVSEFGFLHSSTFGEDDLSSIVALGVMEELDRDDGAVLWQCLKKGELLREILLEQKRRFPDVIKEVRGRGLMVGVELHDQGSSTSPLLRVVSDQNYLGYLVASHLLHEESIRIMPTLSAPFTLRAQPSAYIEPAALERFGAALGRAAHAIRRADSFYLTRHLVGRGKEPTPLACRPQRPLPAYKDPSWKSSKRATHVAFLGHFIDPGDVRDWDPGLSVFTDSECQEFLNRSGGILEPYLVDRLEVRSVRGDLVDVSIIGIPRSSQQVMASYRRGDIDEVVGVIQKGLELARELGCALVGFGGSTSIVTDNCRAIVDDALAITSGNSLTASAALSAAYQTARRLDMGRLTLGVVGGAGNIGSVLAQVAGDEVGDIVLVGRPGSRRRLERTAAEVYFGAWRRLEGQDAKTGLAGAIEGTHTVARLRAGTEGMSRIGEVLRAGVEEELGVAAPVRIATDMSELSKCNLIVSATNAASPIILPEHIGSAPVVVCDVATPQDVHASVAELPGVVVLAGGLLRPPLDQRLDIPGMQLKGGEIYGCLAETILLGFEKLRDNYSYGQLTPYLVRRVRELARLHGFTVSPLVVEPTEERRESVPSVD